MAVRQQREEGETLNGAMAPLTTEHVAGWLDELERLATDPGSLSAAAREALVGTLNAFEAEDGYLPAAAAQARAALTATPSASADEKATSAAAVRRQPQSR